MTKELNDPFGQACLSHLEGNQGLEIEVLCNITETDIIPVDYLFRNFELMPKSERHALQKAKGKTLVVGAGAGCHSIWLQDKGIEVTSIDTSEGAVQTMKQIGLKNVYQIDFFELQETKKYDTIIALMNGIGIAGDLEGLPHFLNKCKNLLKPNGQILADSTDLKYLIENEALEYDINEDEYIGELEYKMIFNQHETDWFKWLYIDEKKLGKIAFANGLKTKIITKDKHFNYLAQLRIV